MKTFAFNLAAALLLTFAHASAEASCGTFEVAKGDVKVQSGSKIAAASQGSKICAGDTVIAADQARAKIKMEDGNELNVSPNSKIVLETYQFDPAQNKKKVLLNILKGKIRATTREENMYTDKSRDGQANTFQVKTKSAVAGVRGTDFLTSYNPSSGKSEVVTFRGQVEVGRAGPGGAIMNPVQVGVGQTTVVLMGKSPETPKALPSIELKKIDSDSSAAPAAGATNSAPPANGSAGEPNGKKDEARADESKRDEPRRDEAKREEPRRDEAKRAEPKGEERRPASGGSMATGNELSGGTVNERGPAMEIKRPEGPIVRPPPPPIPSLPPQVIDAVQKKSTLLIRVKY